MLDRYPLLAAEADFAEGICFEDGQRRLTFADAAKHIQQLSDYLRGKGVSAGNRTAILAPNSIEYLLGFYALHLCGASAVLLNTRLTEADWHAQLDAAAVTHLLHASGSPRFNSHSASIALETAVEEASSRDICYDPCSFEPEQEAAVLFTSGSVGHTKGVRLSHQNFAASAAGSNAITGLAPGDTWLISLPLYHLSGLGAVYRCIYSGARAFFLDSFSDEALAAALSEQEITHLSLVPTQLQLLIDRLPPKILKRLKAIILAGAPSSERLLAQVEELQLPILSAYGMTETTAHCCCMRVGDSLSRVHSVGKAFFNTEIDVVDEEEQSVAVGSVGEIRFRGPTVCLGYLGTQPAPIREAWLYSGDLGVLDEDGYLHIVGRKDDMFISGGENIHPGEIEQAALQHPQLRRAAVIAVEDARWGKRPVLFIEAYETASSAEADTGLVDEVRNLLTQRLAKMKVPERIVALDRLPLTAIGKSDYKALSHLYQSIQG